MLDHPFSDRTRRLAGSLAPAADRDDTVARVDANRDPLRACQSERLREKLRLPNRRGANHHTGGAQTDGLLDPIEGAQTPAHLHAGAAHHRGNDSADQPGVVALTERTIEVHHMHPARAFGHEPLGYCDGIVAVHSLARRFTLTQADDAAVAEVDCGEEIHR